MRSPLSEKISRLWKRFGKGQQKRFGVWNRRQRKGGETFTCFRSTRTSAGPPRLAGSAAQEGVSCTRPPPRQRRLRRLGPHRAAPGAIGALRRAGDRGPGAEPGNGRNSAGPLGSPASGSRTWAPTPAARRAGDEGPAEELDCPLLDGGLRPEDALRLLCTPSARRLELLAWLCARYPRGGPPPVSAPPQCTAPHSALPCTPGGTPTHLCTPAVHRPGPLGQTPPHLPLHPCNAPTCNPGTALRLPHWDPPTAPLQGLPSVPPGPPFAQSLELLTQLCPVPGGPPAPLGDPTHPCTPRGTQHPPKCHRASQGYPQYPPLEDTPALAGSVLSCQKWPDWVQTCGGVAQASSNLIKVLDWPGCLGSLLALGREWGSVLPVG
ncbi:uncharacterized protein LOC142024707 [Carettochelys insculpta]|uniref:uncharacterized protein LOC142024707 n=1 Tax=Carettochelys insculpta TaxID=44489 RepID=UPI003EB83D4D